MVKHGSGTYKQAGSGECRACTADWESRPHRTGPTRKHGNIMFYSWVIHVQRSSDALFPACKLLAPRMSAWIRRLYYCLCSYCSNFVRADWRRHQHFSLLQKPPSPSPPARPTGGPAPGSPFSSSGVSGCVRPAACGTVPCVCARLCWATPRTRTTGC